MKMAKSSGKTAQGEVAQGRVVTLPEKIEDAGALRKVVMRRCRTVALFVDGAANAQKLAP